MKKLHVFFAFLAFVFLLSGCASPIGIMSSDAALGSNNFHYKGIATGSAQTTLIFRIGGLGKEGLVAEAKKDLLTNYPLEDGQALANVTVDFKVSMVLFIVTRKATVTADIVEFEK